jgi:methylated-DNA-[protein]-cysteine S-methyltransferase
MSHTEACALFPTSAGICGIGWNARGITRFQLPMPNSAAAARTLARRTHDAPVLEPPASVAAVIVAVRSYFDGERTAFDSVALDPGPLEAFTASTYAHVRGIPWGDTTTYGEVARALGAGTELAREVGRAMARNPLPLLVPCHRVLAAGGRLGGFSAPGGSKTKARMLAMEGAERIPMQATFAF